MTRWHEMKAAVKASNLPPADRHVYLNRLDQADYATTQIDPLWTRTQAKVASETGLSRRQVQYSEAHLQRHGWLKITGTWAPGKRRQYEVAIGQPCDCTGRVHAPQPTDATPQVSTEVRAQRRRSEVTSARVAPEHAQRVGATPQVRRQIHGEISTRGKGFDFRLVSRMLRIVYSDPCGGIHHDALADQLGLNPLDKQLDTAIAIAYRKRQIDRCDNYIVRPANITPWPTRTETA